MTKSKTKESTTKSKESIKKTKESKETKSKKSKLKTIEETENASQKGETSTKNKTKSNESLNSGISVKSGTKSTKNKTKQSNESVNSGKSAKSSKTSIFSRLKSKFSRKSKKTTKEETTKEEVKKDKYDHGMLPACPLPPFDNLCYMPQWFYNCSPFNQKLPPYMNCVPMYQPSLSYTRLKENLSCFPDSYKRREKRERRELEQKCEEILRDSKNMGLLTCLSSSSSSDDTTEEDDDDGCKRNKELLKQIRLLIDAGNSVGKSSDENGVKLKKCLSSSNSGVSVATQTSDTTLKTDTTQNTTQNEL